MRKILLLAVLVASPLAEARIRGSFHAPRHRVNHSTTVNQSGYDVRAYGLVLTLDPESQTIQGYVDVQVKFLRDLPEVQLDLVDEYQVTDVVELPELDLPFSRVARDRLDIDLGYAAGTETTFRIFYNGKPPIAWNAPWEDGFVWSHSDNGKSWIGVTDEGGGAQVWIPCKDDPSDEAETVIADFTVPQGLVALGNGVLRARTPAAAGWTTYKWETRHAINNYDITVNVGDYEALETAYDGPGAAFPVILYTQREQQQADKIADDPRSYEQKKSDLLKEAVKYLKWHAEYLGVPYPYGDEKFGLAHAPYLGMEHQTLNAYGNHFKLKEGYDWLLFHEMSHEWWGNLLTARDWKDVWLHEGFAAYMEGLYLESLHGKEYLMTSMKETRAHIKFKAPVAFRDSQTAAQAFEGDVYGRGAYLLHTLRFVLGDEVFQAALRAWVRLGNGQPGGFVSSDDFIESFERTSQQKLRGLIEPLLYDIAAPRLTAKRADGLLTLRWEQAGFPMPVEVEFRRADGSARRQVLKFPEVSSAAAIAADEEFVVDPDGWLLLDLKLQ
jgi:aminopeptidase N